MKAIKTAAIAAAIGLSFAAGHWTAGTGGPRSTQGAIPAGDYYLTDHATVFDCSKPASYRVVSVSPDQRIAKTEPGLHRLPR